MSKIFLFKINNTDDRDCVHYIEDQPGRFECDHYFASLNLEGSCFSVGIEQLKEYDYDNITTILTQDELQELVDFGKNLHSLGYGITPGDERYKQGEELCNKVQHIYDKLKSKENGELFSKVIEEEKEWLKDKFDLSSHDVEEIFDDYGLDYRDRSVVSYVYESFEDLGKEHFLQYDTPKGDWWHDYFDFESYAKDLIEDNECYHALDDERVAYINY